MDAIIRKIKENQLFNGLDFHEIEKIFTCCKANIQKYKDNQAVFEKDDIVKNVGIVLEGEFNLVSQKYNGSRVIVTTLGFNDLFGEALIFSSARTSPYDLISSGESKALFIPKKFFIDMCPNSCNFHKVLINNMLAILSDKIIMLNGKMKILNAETIKSKIAVYFLSLYKKTNKLSFDIPMKRQEFAEFLNITRPSLSRELSSMQNENIIDIYRSSIKILDLEKLYELSE
ncbi:CRP-like cAMP-binding protein [Sedimentibacter acidaminivorans]|uniref:CRP-like cAMP-binding protein n=1 Tax=Sedimentibacter acidaminivorans TaxID=913099 RepID=A0ABS4GA10_9FIRM|nr:Crp/Fnr family transcriptional regulator [Sedimentibacter acidaminivorans]MBP1924523.1 CRP-like cAMP-binding protein [Sedimentibacter acidaminivorans]